jgi:zinc-ribbon domain
MTYEYSSRAQRLDFPNPFRIENWFRAIAALLLIGTGLYALFMARENLNTQLDRYALAPILTGLFMLVLGLDHARVALSRLRFFFGRGKPAGLADELNEKQVGDAKGASWVKAVMRENVIPVEEPTGALNGLLYSVLRPLIWAPQQIQWLAQRQFQTGLTLIVTLVGLLVAMASLASGKDLAWVGLFFFVFAAFLLFKPLEQGAQAQAGIGMRGLIALVVVAIFAPVLLHYASNSLPDIGWLDLSRQALILLGCALLAVLIFFFAVLRQMVEPPQTTMACELTTMSMNAPPNQLLDEVDREMQRGWEEQIPNRRYARHIPQAIGASGPFNGELLEETQPMPREDMRSVNFARAFAEPRFQWLTALSALGVLFTAVMAITLILFASRTAAHDPDPGKWKYLFFAGGMFSLALFCLRAGHMLWARFDFVSRLTWVDFNGNFQRAQTAIGAQFTDRVRTEKEIVSINDMTLRVWVAEIDTVTFGRDSERRVVGLRGRPDLAASLSEHLRNFATEQSSVDMPTSQRDAQKIAAINTLNRVTGEADPALTLAGAAKPSTHYCSNCGKPLTPDARFCSHCGTSTNQP